MILEEETQKTFGYLPSELKPHSSKRVVTACDDCGKKRIVRKNHHCPLCNACANSKRHLSKERRKKISDSKIGKNNPMYGKKGKDNPVFGKHHSDETKKSWSLKRKNKQCGEDNPFFGRQHTDEVKQRLRESHSGANNSRFGKHHSDETKKKMSKSHSNRSIETRRKISKSKTGELHPNWQGGISFEPYCPKFNNDLKERVRIFFGRKCYLCGKPEEENGRKLSVHHVNYDKMACCNDTLPLFVPLCGYCHIKTNINRDYWLTFFESKITKETNGKCFNLSDEVPIND